MAALRSAVVGVTPAFVNSLLTISDAYTVFLETDTPFDSVLSATLRDTLAAHTVPLRWQRELVYGLTVVRQRMLQRDVSSSYC